MLFRSGEVPGDQVRQELTPLLDPPFENGIVVLPHLVAQAHRTTNDGDAIFVMATGDVEAGVDAVGMLATTALEYAIVSGIRDAESAYGYIAARDLA